MVENNHNSNTETDRVKLEKSTHNKIVRKWEILVGAIFPLFYFAKDTDLLSVDCTILYIFIFCCTFFLRVIFRILYPDCILFFLEYLSHGYSQPFISYITIMCILTRKIDFSRKNV